MSGEYRECLDLSQIMQRAGKALRRQRDINPAMGSIWVRGGKDSVSRLEGRGEKSKDSERTKDSAKMQRKQRRWLSRNEEKSKFGPHELGRSEFQIHILRPENKDGVRCP